VGSRRLTSWAMAGPQSSLTRAWVCLLRKGLAFVKCAFTSTPTSRVMVYWQAFFTHGIPGKHHVNSSSDLQVTVTALCWPSALPSIYHTTRYLFCFWFIYRCCACVGLYSTERQNDKIINWKDVESGQALPLWSMKLIKKCINTVSWELNSARNSEKRWCYN
jgi:hypothetical protein